MAATLTCIQENTGLAVETLRRALPAAEEPICSLNPTQLGQRGALQPGKHCRRWGCTQGRGPLQWHRENVEDNSTGWSRRQLRF